MRRPALLFVLPLVLACHVSRVPEESAAGPADLPRLRRANTALQERILLEKQHVAHFNAELRATRDRERVAAFELEEAEADYQRLLSDLGGIDLDIADVNAELENSRQALQSLRDELDSTKAEIAAAEDEAAVLFAAGRRHQESVHEMRQREELARQGEAQAALDLAAAEASRAAVHAQLSQVLQALGRSRTAETLLSRELLVSLLISRLRGEGPGALMASRLVAAGGGVGTGPAPVEAVEPPGAGADGAASAPESLAGAEPAESLADVVEASEGLDQLAPDVPAAEPAAPGGQ